MSELSVPEEAWLKGMDRTSPLAQEAVRLVYRTLVEQRDAMRIRERWIERNVEARVRNEACGFAFWVGQGCP